MKVSELFYNFKCDCCGKLVDPESWWREQEALDQMYHEEGWKHLGGKDYCPCCWNWNDDDNIVTNDGKKFDGENYEEIV